MTHLTPEEFVDAAEGQLSPGRLQHLERCGTCRREVSALSALMGEAAGSPFPEPSPLFWEHFSARVHEGVRDAESGVASTWYRWVHGETFTWAMSGALLTLLLVAGVWVSVWRARMPAPAHGAASATIAATTPAADAATDRDFDAFDPDTDQAWALVRTVADDVSWDDAEAVGFGARPGSAERAMATLTTDERSELVRLLQAETKQPGA